MQPLNRPLQPNPLILPEPKHSLQKIFDFLSYGKAYFCGTYDQTKDVDTRYNWVIHQLKVLNKERGESSFWIQWNIQGHHVYLEIQKEIDVLRPLNLRDLSSSEKDIDAIQQLATRDKAIEHRAVIQEKVGEVQESLDKLKSESLEPSWPQWLLKHLSAIREIEEKIQSLEPLQKFFVIGERGAIEELPGIDVQDLKKRLSHTLFQIAEKHFVAFVEKDYRSYQQQVQEKIAHLRQERASYLKKNWNYAWSFWGNYWEQEHPEDARFLRSRVDYLKTLHLATALPRLKDFREEISSPESLRIQFEDLFPSQTEGSITKICRIVKAFYFPSNLPSLPLPQAWEEHRHIGVGLGDTPKALALQLLFSDPFLARFAIEGEGQSQEIKQLYTEYLRADWNCHWVSWQEFIRAPSNKDAFWLNPHASFKKREPFKLNPLQLQNFPQTAKAALEELTAHLDSQANPLFHTLVTRKLGSAEKQEVQQAIIDLEWTSINQPQDLEETPPYQPQTLELLLKEKFCLTNPQEGKEFTQFSKFPEVLLIHLSKSSQTKKEPFGIMEHLYLNSDFSSETSSGACYELVSFLVDKTHYRKTDFGYFSIQNDVVKSISREVFLENAKTSTLAVFRRSSESFTAEEIHAQATQNLYRFYIDLYRPLTIEAALGRSKYTTPDNQQRGMQCLTSFVSSLVCSPSFPRKQIGLFPRNPNDFTEYTFNELPTPFQQFLWDIWKPSSQSSQQPNPSFLQDIRSKLLLQADELPLDIPPHPDEQKYDKDGFVLTLLADRLFKYLQKHPEKILHDPMQKTLYLATHHAIAQVAAARRIQKIRLSVLIEETVQITTTLALAPFTKNKKSHLRQQAISTTSRVFSIIVDPLQESPHLQKIMQIGTSVVLCGESLDDPDLSEKDKDNIAALFFAKSIFSHAPGSILPTIPEKHRHLYDSTTDIALTLSTAYLKETPAPIASWVTSYALRRLDRSLILPLSPDTPQSTYNFYAARIISPILSNSTLHTLTAEKALKAIQDLTKRPPSPNFSQFPPQILPEVDEENKPKTQITIEEESKPIAPNSELDLPPIEMHDPEGYQRLLFEEGVIQAALERENSKLIDPNYSKFGTPQDTRIQKQAGVVEAEKNLQIKKDKDGGNPKHAREAERKLTKAYDNRNTAVREDDAVKSYIDQTTNNIASLTERLQANRLAQAKASAPKHIPVPEISIHKIVAQKTKKNHHLHGVDSKGNAVSLGKYPKAEDARFICGMFTKVDTQQASLDVQCYNAQRQAEDAGIAIDDIPKRPTFGMPTILGNDVDANYKTLQTTSIDDQRKAQSFIKSIQDLTGKPVDVQGLSKAEINQIASQLTPKIKEIPQDSLWDKTVKAPGKAYDATSKFLGKIGFSTAGAPNGAVNIGTISSPEINRARGEPTLFHHDLKPESTGRQPSSPYWETRHQIAMDRAGLQGVASKPIQASQQPKPNTAQNWGWQGVESMQQQQLFDRNMAYNSPVNNSPQTLIEYHSMQGPGMSSTAQFPPADFSGLGRNAELSPGTTNQRQIQMAGFAPSTGSQVSAKILQGVVSLFLPDMSDMPGAENPMDHINRLITAEAIDNFVKSIPKGTANVLVAGACLMLPDMSDVPGAEDPRTHLKMVTKNAFLKYDDIMQIDPNAFSSKAGEFFGEMLAFGGAGKVIKIAEGVSIFGMACEGGMAGLVMAEAHDTNKVAGVAFGFAGGAVFGAAFSRTKPEMKALIDRMKAQPQGFGQQVRAIEALQQPALRSGVVSEGAVTRLSSREIKAIKPMKLPYLKKGVDWEWFAENSPKIDQFRNLHPRDPKKLYLAVRREFKPQNLNELQIRRTLDYAGFKTYAIPEGLPSNVMLEFADKNGGMVYRKLGSTNPENLVVRVCPGLAKESIPSSYINGGINNGTLRQQTPYVVQTNGAFKLRTDGTWTRNQKDPATHLPLETYHFKGWE